MSFQKNEKLTPRQIEILKLVADGNTSRQIAIKLNIACQTTKTHRHNIYRRLDAMSAAHAVAIGIREGIIE